MDWMILKHFHIGKTINIVTNNGGVMSGIVIEITDNFLVLSTRLSSKHMFKIKNISSFYYDEDKPSE